MTLNIPFPDGSSFFTSLVAVLTAGLVLAAGSQQAEAAPDQDGRFPISVEELDGRRAEIFALVDSNGDGLVSAEEFAAAELPNRSHARHQGRRGGGYHGESSSEEIALRAEALEENLFLTLDADADGVISRSEFSMPVMREARKAAMKSRVFERADTDGDGYLSPDEFPPRRLATLDTNGDGQISADEWPDRHRGGYRDGNAS